MITSSCEIAASMLLSKEEFISLKAELVEDVIGILHLHASKEAELLFREYNNYPGNLPHFSQRISEAINRVTDAITNHLAGKGSGMRKLCITISFLLSKYSIVCQRSCISIIV